MKKELLDFVKAVAESPCMTNHQWTDIEKGSAGGGYGINYTDTDSTDNDYIRVWLEIWTRWNTMGGGWNSLSCMYILSYSHYLSYLNNKEEADNYIKIVYSDKQNRIFYILDQTKPHILEEIEKEKQHDAAA